MPLRIFGGRQGPDVDTQYRSAILYHTPDHKRIAEESKAELEKATCHV